MRNLALNRNWYCRLVCAANTALEDIIFAAVGNLNVDQSSFNKMIAEWIGSTNPELLRVPMNRRLPRGGAGNITTSFLSGQNSPTYMEIAERRKAETGKSNLGLIAQPLTVSYLRSEICNKFDGFAIDNGMFTESGRKTFSWDKYEKMVKIALAQEKRGLGNFHFFTVPDEPFNWQATMEKFQTYRDRVRQLRKLGAPVAVVIQNGATPNNVPFEEVDSVFIGGDDAYKVGPAAKAITEKARSMNMNVHMGRVNTLNRMNVASTWGVDSADGTCLMHEFAKVLHKLYAKNPKQAGESDQAYDARIKQMFESKDGPLTEASVVESFVYNVVDRQINNPAAIRYKQIARMVGETGSLDRAALWQLTQMPEAQDVDSPDDVVEYDENDQIRLDRQGRPVKNRNVFDRLDYGIYPSEKGSESVPPQFIGDMRRRGLLPR